MPNNFRDFPHVNPRSIVRGWRGELVNAVFDAVRFRDVPQGPHGRGDRSGNQTRPRPYAKDHLSWHRCISSDNVDPFSIVEVYDSTVDATGPLLKVNIEGTGTGSGTATTSITEKLYAGNEQYTLIRGKPGWVKLITPYEPVLVRASLDTQFYDDLEIDGSAVTPGAATGLIALSPRNSEERCYVLYQPIAKTARFKITQTGVGTGTGSTDSTEAVYRTSHPAGVYAQRVDELDAPNGIDELIYADFVRGVYITGDVVWCEYRNSEWQIRDDGTLLWKATAIVDVVSGGPGLVRLHHANSVACAVQASTFDSTDSITTGTDCLVTWMDGSQQFYALPVTCPASAVEYA